ncbi:MAG TPA: ATP-binding protein [Povalibacter sp.]
MNIETSSMDAASALQDAGGESWRNHASRHVSVGLLALLFGAAATFSAAYLQHLARSSEAGKHFSAGCEDRQQRVRRTIDSHVEVLYGVRALFNSSEFVSPQAFDHFALEAVERHVHIRSLGFLQDVSDAERDRFEAQYSQLFGQTFAIMDPAPDGRLTRAPRRPAYLPLIYAQGTERMPVGIDALQNPQVPAVLAALHRENAIHAVIATLPEEEQLRRFVHIYLPILKVGMPASTEPYGYVRLRLVLEELIADVVSEAHAAGIEVRLDVPAEGAEITNETHEDLVWSESIPLADRTLLLSFRATDAYVGKPSFWSRWPLLAAGGLVTLLATIGAMNLSISRMRLQDMTRSLLVQVRERQLSEKRTAQSEERYRVLVENSPDAIVLLKQRSVVFANRMALRLLGAQSDEELVGRDALDLVHPDYQEIVRQRHEAMKQTQSILPPVEGRLVRLDRTTIDVEVRAVPFTSDGVQLFHVAVRDITERRHAERERASLEAALRQAQRLEAIGTLTGGIAHDFNNILSSIVGNIQLLMDDLPKGHPARQSAHEIRNATNRARDLVKRLMAFSREQEAPQSQIAVAPLIDEVQQLMRPALPSGVELRVHVPADTPAVIADATQLHQVLVNLCTNASQAMPSGQGQIDVIVTTISATDACGRSKVSLEGAKRYVCIEVRDTGSGIAPEVADRIFEPFFTTKRAGEGSGLGLAVVHGIIQSHKGAITVSSRVGVGTSFFVYLPASELLPVPVAESTVKELSRGANQHVLYIDDEEPLVFLVTRVLERSGYRCTGCTDPPHAMHVLATNPQSFDLVITDMNMPGMSGIDVARQVLEIRPELPVVITTGYVRSSDIAAIRDMGVRDLILKPDTIEELAAVVGRYLEQPVAVV